MSVKNSNDIIGNRTPDLPTCNAVPQSSAPPRTPREYIYIYIYYIYIHTHIYIYVYICIRVHKFSEIWGLSQNFRRQADDTEANSVLRTHIY